MASAHAPGYDTRPTVSAHAYYAAELASSAYGSPTSLSSSNTSSGFSNDSYYDGVDYESYPTNSIQAYQAHAVPARISNRGRGSARQQPVSNVDRSRSRDRVRREEYSLYDTSGTMKKETAKWDDMTFMVPPVPPSTATETDKNLALSSTISTVRSHGKKNNWDTKTDFIASRFGFEGVVHSARAKLKVTVLAD